MGRLLPIDVPTGPMLDVLVIDISRTCLIHTCCDERAYKLLKLFRVGRSRERRRNQVSRRC